jgi:tetratricopeptide (TPR) repeat protein
MGQKQEADACYQKAFQNRIHRAADLATLGRFCIKRGWWQAAITNFNDAIQLDPLDPALQAEAGQAHFLFGAELGKSRQPALASREFQEAVRLMPDVIEARLNLGIALYKDGQFEQSLPQFEQVAARSPTNALAQHYLDLLHNKLGPQK